MNTYINVKKNIENNETILNELYKKVVDLYKKYNHNGGIDLKTNLKAKSFILSPVFFQYLKEMKRKLS